MADEIAIKLSTDPEQSTASLSGVHTCGSVWSCPVCAMREAVKRGREIAQALDWADENAYTTIMLTFTARHHNRMALADFKSQFKTAYRAMTQSREWRRIKKIMALDYGIRATEITYGKHGWHYHYHLLFFVKNEVLAKLDTDALAEWQSEIESAWLHQLARVGLSGIGEYAFDVRFDGNVGDHYLAKLGLSTSDTTDSRHELSGYSNKGGKGATVWDILRRSQPGQPGASRWAARYVEYVEAMQGDNWINWSPGFKEIVGVDGAEVDDHLLEEQIEMETWLVIPDKLYRYVAQSRAYGELLALAAQTRSKVAVNDWLRLLEKMHTTAPDPPLEELRQRLSAVKRARHMTRKAIAEEMTYDDVELLQRQNDLIRELESQIDKCSVKF